MRSSLRNKYWVQASAENKAAYKKHRNKSVKIGMRSITKYMDKISEKGMETNRSFWNFIKPFRANKGMIAVNDITLIDGRKKFKTFNKQHSINTILTLSKKVAETSLIT